MDTLSYTTVLGIDAKHFQQLCLVWLTWKIHKPSILNHPMVIFVDKENPVDYRNIESNIDHPDLHIVSWPPEDVFYPEAKLDEKDKFGKSQRYKMLAGFAHIPAMFVQTPYWFKLDSDAYAIGHDDWIDPEWFKNDPNIVGHRWGFTKPANFIDLLDQWVEKNPSIPFDFPTASLNLPRDSPESERVSHPRIASWCSFFKTSFTVRASRIANKTCGYCMLPVPSQDTYHWYMATRTDPASVVRVNMKQHGWGYKSSYKSVKEQVLKALGMSQEINSGI